MRGFEVDSLYNFFSLELNYLVSKITMELPLSAHVNVASLFWSLDCILFKSLVSCCVRLCLESELLFFLGYLCVLLPGTYTCRDLSWGVLILRFLLPSLCLIYNFLFCVNYI